MTHIVSYVSSWNVLVGVQPLSLSRHRMRRSTKEELWWTRKTPQMWNVMRTQRLMVALSYLEPNIEHLAISVVELTRSIPSVGEFVREPDANFKQTWCSLLSSVFPLTVAKTCHAPSPHARKTVEHCECVKESARSLVRQIWVIGDFRYAKEILSTTILFNVQYHLRPLQSPTNVIPNMFICYWHVAFWEQTTLN